MDLKEFANEVTTSNRYGYSKDIKDLARFYIERQDTNAETLQELLTLEVVKRKASQTAFDNQSQALFASNKRLAELEKELADQVKLVKDQKGSIDYYGNLVEAKKVELKVIKENLSTKTKQVYALLQKQETLEIKVIELEKQAPLRKARAMFDRFLNDISYKAWQGKVSSITVTLNNEYQLHLGVAPFEEFQCNLTWLFGKEIPDLKKQETNSQPGTETQRFSCAEPNQTNTSKAEPPKNKTVYNEEAGPEASESFSYFKEAPPTLIKIYADGRTIITPPESNT